MFLCTGECLEVSSENAKLIAEKIWKNECGGTIEGLTCWNKGENFASLGIGHFIWYTEENQERFEETFPYLLTFLQAEGAVLPDWLKAAKGCPWKSREEFYLNLQSPKMAALRQFLIETKDLQAIFIAKRLEKQFPLMIINLSKNEQENVLAVFNALSNDLRGLYALIDYLNFKGAGILTSETYNGQGWGLLQVLLKIQPSSNDILADFVNAAENVLMQRVQNAPTERNEERWLAGWLKRIRTYLD